MLLLGDALAAFREIWTPPFRLAAFKIFGLTLALLLLTGTALHHWLTGLVTLPSSWLATLVSWLEGLGLLAGSIFLVAPISALVAGFFVDDLAAAVEQDLDPAAAPGRALPVAHALWLSVRFAALSLGVMLLALVLLLVPGVNAVAFLGANAYLSGRQYFEFAGLRFQSLAEAEALRRRHAATVLAAGLCIAVFLSVPVLNLLTPLFGTALMVRVFGRLAGRDAIPRGRIGSP